MRIQVSDTDTNGQFGPVTLSPGIRSVGDYFRAYKPGRDPGSFTIMVTGQTVTDPNYPLSEGCKLTISAKDQKGAA